MTLNSTDRGKVTLRVRGVTEAFGSAADTPGASAFLARDKSHDIGVLIVGLDLGLRIGENDTCLAYLVTGFEALPHAAQHELIAQLSHPELIVNDYAFTLAREHPSVVARTDYGLTLDFGAGDIPGEQPPETRVLH